MGDRKRILFLVLIMTMVAMTIGSAAIGVLYHVSLEERRLDLVQFAKAEARLIEAMARFDEAYSSDYPGGAFAATISQIRDAHEHYTGYGETGEFTLAQRQGDNIVFLLRHRPQGLDTPKSVPFSSKLAEPMRRALLGQTGSVTGLDYKGSVVLAAYEPVGGLNLGIVSKIDVAEIRAPFIKAGAAIAAIAIVVVLMGTIFFFRISDPIIRRTKENEHYLIKTNRALAMLSNCNQALVRSTTEEELLNQICDIIVETGGYRLAWVGLAGDDAAKSIYPVAQSGYEAGYLETLNITWADTERGCGPTGTAIREDKTCMSRNIQEDPSFQLWRDEAVKRGYASSVAIPLLEDNKAFGALSVYATEPDAFDEIEMERLTELANNLAYGILSRRELAERKEVEAQFRHAQKMEATGVLAGGIAHDFNNILTGILGHCYLASEEIPEGNEALFDLEQIEKAGNRAKSLVQQLLTFSHRREAIREPVEFKHVVEEVLTLISASTPATIDIRTEISDNSSLVEADSTQIHQVLMNLFSNAVDAIGDSPGTIKVELKEFDCISDVALLQSNLPGGRYMKMSVSDDGHGMSRNVIECIFDPFFTTKEVGKGTGLGLAAVHGIVEDHGGAIDVRSGPGKGSTFSIFLPRLSGKKKSSVSPKETMPVGDERILVVDDERFIIQMISRLLRRLGYHVDATTNSQTALKIFRSKPKDFDLVITDQIMPNLTGDALAQELTEIRPGIPIILYTGYSHSLTPETAAILGIREIVKKPVEPNNLAKTVRRILDQELNAKDPR